MELLGSGGGDGGFIGLFIRRSRYLLTLQY